MVCPIAPPSIVKGVIMDINQRSAMRKISVFNFLTLNGYYKGVSEDISWHRHGPEESDFAGDAAKPKKPNSLLFGRITYEMMAAFWPSEMGMQMNAKVSEGMTNANKYVFSKTMKSASWKNTTILAGDIISETEKLKQSDGPEITILGSGTIVRQLAEQNLIDHYTFMIDPVALGEGTPVFNGLTKKLDLELIDSKAFKSGVLLVNYRPLK